MEEKQKVVLHGMWASPFVRWVKIALNIKGITYEYVEESMTKKGQLLLEYNPAYKKVPVLVHDGHPITESLVIVCYIDEVWKGSPQFLPQNPYSRSMVHFWADFMLKQLHMSLRKLVASHHETEEKKSITEFQKNMNILEENVEIIFPCDVPSCGEDMGMLDMLLSTLPNAIYAIEEALNVTLMEPKKYQSTFSRMEALSRLAVVKDTAPPQEKLVRFFRAYRHFYCDKK